MIAVFDTTANPMPKQKKRQAAVNNLASENRAGTGKVASKNKQVPLSNRLISLVIPRIVFGLRSDAQEKIKGIAKMSELEARMIAELEKYGELTMSGLVEIVGNDKSQVSRALKRLLANKLVTRDSIRSPLSLTQLGKMYFLKLGPASRRHNSELLKNLSASEQAFFAKSLTRLIEVAAQMLEQERHADAGDTANKPGRKSGSFARLSTASHEIPPNLVVPSHLFALGKLLQRSAFLAFKRLTKLSNNECLVLTYIWEHAPVTSTHLTQIAGCAKDRTDRAVMALMRADLIRRAKSVFSHDWIYDRAEAGGEIYKDSLAELERRERILIQPFRVQDLKKFRSLLDRVVDNVAAMSASNPGQRQ